MKKGLDVLKYIWFSLMGIAELIFGMYFLVSFLGSINGSTPILFVLLLTFVLLLLIDIFAIIRLTDKKFFPFISTRLMKLFVFFSGMTAALYLDDEITKDTADVMTVVCSVLGIAAIAFGWYTFKKSPNIKNYRKPHAPNSLASYGPFIEDSVDSRWDAAAKEYFNGEVDRNSVSREDEAKIRVYAAMPIVCYFCWLLRNDMLDEDFEKSLPHKLVKALRDQEDDPLALFDRTKGVLSRSMLDINGQLFTDEYYWGGDDTKPFSYGEPCYRFDYFKVFGGNANYYLNDFSWEKQLELEKLLEKRHTYFIFNSRRKIFYPFGKAETRLFGKNVPVNRSSLGKKEYAERCVNEIKKPDNELAERICSRLNEYYEATHKVPLADKNAVFGLFGSCRVYIYPQIEDEPVYTIVGVGELKNGKGCGFTVKGNYVSKVADRKKLEDPFSRSFEIHRSLDDPNFGGERTVSLFPHELGGPQSADNILLVPEVIADFKEECDRRVICLMKQSNETNISYSCNPIYKKDKLVGVQVMVKTVKGKKLFDDEMSIK